MGRTNYTRFGGAPDALRAHKAGHTRQNSWWLCDVRGIEVSRVCDMCEADVKAAYDPAIFGESDARYDDVVEDRIEPDDA